MDMRILKKQKRSLDATLRKVAVRATLREEEH